MEAAPWSMTDEGEWVLNEPYASEVKRIRRSITEAFNERLLAEVAAITPYTVEQLEPEYIRMATERDQYPTDLVASFIIEAMSGQLGK